MGHDVIEIKLSYDQLQPEIAKALQEVLPVYLETLLKKKLLTGKDIQAEYGIKERTLEKWRALGRGPSYTEIGRKVFYERTVFDQFIEARRVQTTGEAD